MRPMSVFNLYEYIWVSPEEIMEYDYWLSEQKDATYHAIEYQLSKEVLYSWSVVCTMHYFCALFLCVGSCIKRRQLISSHYLCQGCVRVVYNLIPFLHRMNEWWSPVTVILTFESVNEILWCDHSNETSLASTLWFFSVFQHFRKKIEILPKIYVKGSYNLLPFTEAILILP